MLRSWVRRAGTVEILKSLGFHQLAMEIEKMLRGVPIGAPSHEGNAAGAE